MDNKTVDNLFSDIVETTLAYVRELKRQADELREELRTAEEKIASLEMRLYGRTNT